MSGLMCAVCGTGLPDGALFCGECGSSATAASRVRAIPDVSGPGAPVSDAPGSDARGSDTSVLDDALLDDAVLPMPAATPAPAEPATADPPRAESAAVAPAAVPQQVRPKHPTATFVLHFSTGETATVSGSGLIGRRPIEQPGERFDHMVAIEEPQRSVSKTHLEFGMTGMRMWVSDRYSGNGSVLREPGGRVRRMRPGRRYVIERGTRIDIGAQFVVVR